MTNLGTRTTARSTPPAPALQTRTSFVDSSAVYLDKIDPPSATNARMQELTTLVVLGCMAYLPGGHAEGKL